MWICQHCRAEIESDDWDTCWNCQWSRTGEPPAPDAPPPESEPLDCLRCQNPLQSMGSKQFHQRGFILVPDQFDLFVCPRCGHVEFFLSEVSAGLRRHDDEFVP